MPPLGRVSPPIQEASAGGREGEGKGPSRFRHCGSTGSPGLPAPFPLPPSLFPLSATAPAPAPAVPGASAARTPLPAGREWRRRGAAPSCSNSCLLDRPRSSPPRSGGRGRGDPSAQGRGGKGHAARGVAGPRRASPSASLPPRPPGQVSTPHTPGSRPAPRAWAGAAPGRPGHGAVTCRAVLPASARGRPQCRGDAKRDPPGAGALGALLP